MCAVTQAFKTCYGNTKERGCQGSSQGFYWNWVLKEERAFLGYRKNGRAFQIEKSMCQGT